MIRRYIIWRNNHAYDERLRRIVDRANAAGYGTSTLRFFQRRGYCPCRNRDWSREALVAPGRVRGGEYGPAATVDDGQAQAERDRPTRPGGLVRGCRAALAAGQANNDRARAGRSSSPIQNDHSGHVANSRPTSR
jgi:hypothetical protein